MKNKTPSDLKEKKGLIWDLNFKMPWFFKKTKFSNKCRFNIMVFKNSRFDRIFTRRFWPRVSKKFYFFFFYL